MSDSHLNANVEKENQSSRPKLEDFTNQIMTPPESDGLVLDSEAVPPAEDLPVEKTTGDLEALHQTPSGPVYSVFGNRQRKFIVFMVACAGFFSPLSANIYFPALNALSRDLKVSNELINLTLTSYMIFQGLAPTIFGDFADMAGRRPAYILGFIIYIGNALYHPIA